MEGGMDWLEQSDNLAERLTEPANCLSHWLTFPYFGILALSDLLEAYYSRHSG